MPENQRISLRFASESLKCSCSALQSDVMWAVTYSDCRAVCVCVTRGEDSIIKYSTAFERYELLSEAEAGSLYGICRMYVCGSVLMFVFLLVVVPVSDLEPESLGDNLKVKVMDVKILVDRPKFDGGRVRVGEALVGDNSGCIILTLKNEQLDCVSVGDSLEIRNCKVDMFKGCMRVVVDRWGLIKKAGSEHPFKVNVDNNLSNVEYELVEIPV